MQLDKCFKMEKEFTRAAQLSRQRRNDPRVVAMETYTHSEEEEFTKWYQDNSVKESSTK